MYDFTYTKPSSLPDALRMLVDDVESKPLAGGQTFIPVLKQRLNRPTAVVDLSGAGAVGHHVGREHGDDWGDDDAP